MSPNICQGCVRSLHLTRGSNHAAVGVRWILGSSLLLSGFKLSG
ncbi:hypothetical protein CFBP5473_14065 [Agrobacterium larrymoorei]|uniref:Uncharacterized protein n=1 Tax=Agrobacterium larrymoorei TaxID=160699 RepID=A0A4D7DR97_9HYPH|nr:hypothetical protein CFBP5473_14065 [Agrobacterium larrymoorei]